MKANLSVPLLKQPPNSNQCGQYCVKMVLDFFGKTKEIDEIGKLCKYTRGGTLDQSLAVALYKSGTLPYLYTLPDNDTFLTKYKQLTEQKVADSFNRRARKSKSRIVKRGYRDLAILSEENLLKFVAPVPKVIKQEIDCGHPWIASVNIGSFYNNVRSTAVGHYVVVVGYNDDYLLINDPAKGILVVREDIFAYSNARMDGIAICVSNKKDEK